MGAPYLALLRDVGGMPVAYIPYLGSNIGVGKIPARRFTLRSGFFSHISQKREIWGTHNFYYDEAYFCVTLRENEPCA